MKMDVRKKLDQIRRGKKNNNKPGSTSGARSKSDVKDLRQIIAKKTKKKTPTSKDLRETNKKLITRKKPTNPVSSSRNEVRPVTRSTRRTITTTSGGPRQHHQQPDQQYYVPPPIRRNQSVYTAPHPVVSQRTSSVVANPPEHHSGASVLISNLNPAITQSDIIELYGEVGVLTAVNMINQTTALVTYQNSSDAFRAVKVYHNRLLDGHPMYVNMMPTSL